MLLTTTRKSAIIVIVNINILQEHNPWWRRPEFILDDNFIVEFSQQKYAFYHPLYQSLAVDKDGVLTLRGPRRIGKTTLFKLLIKRLLLKDRIDKENVFFFPADTLRDYKELEEVLVLYLNYIRAKTDKRLFIFLDEISFVSDWQRTIKLLVDSGKLKNTLCLITGSNILDFKYSLERLPGRRGEIFPWDITFLPLSFNQFVGLVEPKLLSQPLSLSLPLLPKFQKLFYDYLHCGGFPVVISEYFSKGYLATPTYEIFLAWVEGDLHRVGKNERTFYQILSQVFSHLTTPLSLYKLSKEAGVSSHVTVAEYLEIAEKMFLLFRLSYFSLEEKKVYLRKNSKIYLADPFIFNCLKAKVEGFSQSAFSHSQRFVDRLETRPTLVENAAAFHLQRIFPSLYFGRGSKDKEIDFVGFKEGKFAFFEIKYQKKVRAEEFSWTKGALGNSKLTVLTQNDYQKGKANLIPTELFLGYFSIFQPPGLKVL